MNPGFLLLINTDTFETFSYFRLFSPNLFGGVTAFTKDHFQLVNGYANRYWGWGAEDDDSLKR